MQKWVRTIDEGLLDDAGLHEHVNPNAIFSARAEPSLTDDGWDVWVTTIAGFEDKVPFDTIEEAHRFINRLGGLS